MVDQSSPEQTRVDEGQLWLTERPSKGWLSCLTSTPRKICSKRGSKKSLYPLGEKLTLDAETFYSSFLIHHFGAVEMISKKRSIQTLCKVGTISPPQIAPVVIALPRETDRGGPFLSSRRQIIQNIFILYLFLLWEALFLNLVNQCSVMHLCTLGGQQQSVLAKKVPNSAPSIWLNIR